MKKPVRYLATALRDDYAAPEKTKPAASSDAVAIEFRRRQDAADAKLAEVRREAEITKAPRERAVKLAKVQTAAAARDPDLQLHDIQLFAKRPSAELDRAGFARQGWASALHAQAIFAFWEEIESGIFSDL